MGRKRSQHSTFGPDDYDQPTEPMERLVPAQTNPTYRMSSSPADAWITPAPPLETSFWPQGTPAVSPYRDQAQAYPVLPPVRQSAHTRKRHWSPLPGLVELFFVLAQLALLGRVACILLGITRPKPWIDLLFVVSNLLVWPTRWLAANINLSLLAGTQLLIYLEFLLTILVYGLLSRILVRILKALLNG